MDQRCAQPLGEAGGDTEGPDIDADVSPEFLDPDDEPQGLFDIADSFRDFGYAPKVSIDEGIARYVDWLRRPMSVGRGPES